MITIEQLKQLRQETAISVSECKKALEEAKGDLKLAKEILKKWGKDLAGKKISRGTSQGIIESYIHPNKKIGVLLELACETDFVAKSKDFQGLSHELCLQIAAMGEETLLGEEDKSSSSTTESRLRDEGGKEHEALFDFATARLLEQSWIKDQTKTIKDLIEEYIVKLGENIIIKRFVRYEL